LSVPLLVRTWPALDVHPVDDLLQAALVDYDVTAVDERADATWRVFFVSAAERDRAALALRAAFPGVAAEALEVEGDDWAARSQASLRAVRVSAITVAPPWDVPSVDAPSAITIVIQPSMGFGTGHHATTRLCLAALQRIDLRGCSVIDVGTGSGVLAIAASVLGADHVVAIDSDADAIEAARENLLRNDRARVTLVTGDLRSADLPRTDVVVANLTGGLLEAAAPQLLRLSEGGQLVLSGLQAEELPGIRAAYSSRRVENVAEEDGWICVTLR
jgi:ribosomal protein L11 methyltransferase